MVIKLVDLEFDYPLFSLGMDSRPLLAMVVVKLMYSSN